MHRKQTIELSLDAELVAEAKAAGTDLSALLERASARGDEPSAFAVTGATKTVKRSGRGTQLAELAEMGRRYRP